MTLRKPTSPAKRVVYIAAGVILIVAGLPLFWTPIPVGAAMVLIGAALIVANSNTMRDWLHVKRADHDRLDRWMKKTEKFTPGAFARVLRETEPTEDEKRGGPIS